jgi:2-C-methyl-D-erythritol 2,4-cyclodiphosphate synthase
MRIGIGYDIHRLVEERKLFLAGVEIPYIKGLISFTDGDVVLHAIADAMLGGISMGDIGQHFPNTDPKLKELPSSEIIKRVLVMVDAKNYRVNNIDTMIIAEEPKIHPFRDAMIDTLSGLLKIGKDRINIKATTNEGVGSIGRGDAIAAYAVVTLEEKK